MRVSYNEKRFLSYGVTFLSFQGIYECIIPLTNYVENSIVCIVYLGLVALHLEGL